MIGLSAESRIEYIELVSLGGARVLNVEPMNVFRFAVMKNAAAAIMAHNHPSGNLKPSDSDKDMTDRLIQVGRILAIEALDHFIISEKSYVSFESIGLFKELQESLKYVPTFEIIERIRAEETRIREEAVILAVLKEKSEKTVTKEKIEIAKMGVIFPKKYLNYNSAPVQNIY